VTLHRHSSRSDIFRQFLRNGAFVLSSAVEPIRSIVRNKLLDKITARSKAQDQAISAQHNAAVSDAPTILFLLVYRRRNIVFVELLLRQLGPNADVRLWALDEVAPDLASQTYGCGPGVRFSHLNFLYKIRPVEQGSWLVIADDDIVFVKGDLFKTIGLMKDAGFSLAQPGQSLLGWWTNLFNVSRPFVIARDTNFVEQGPLVVADSSFLKLMLPLPEGADMGWGIEAEWNRIKEGRFRIGIIDECRIVHWRENAQSYPAGPEMEKLKERLTAAGISSFYQLLHVNMRWWKWQRRPHWREASSAEIE
jgi:hypothetical protein